MNAAATINCQADTMSSLQIAELTKKGSLCLAAGYDAKLRMRIIDRWEQLEVEKRNGGFAVTQNFKEALLLAAQQQEQQEQQAPKVLFAKAVETSDMSVLIADLARIIKQNGVEIGQNRLFGWLRGNGYLCSKGEMYNVPTQRAMEMGLFEIKKTTITKPNGSILISTTPKVTGKGQVFFVNKFLHNAISYDKRNKHSIVQLLEGLDAGKAEGYRRGTA